MKTWERIKVKGARFESWLLKKFLTAHLIPSTNLRLKQVGLFMNIAPAVYKRIIAGKLYMDQNFQDPIDLGAISREACISRFHFHRLFTQVYNRTPHQYLTRKRITLACELLQDENLSIASVCNSIGFESIGSFSMLFKKETGINPRTYRSNALLMKDRLKKFPDSFVPFCFLNACTQQ